MKQWRMTRIAPDLVAELERRAEAEDRSFAYIVNQLLRLALDNLQQER